MTNVHWIGNGLSSVPGIKHLAQQQDNKDWSLVLWCRRVADGKSLLADTPTSDVRSFNWASLEAAIAVGDVVVSMLPVTEHVKVAKLCLRQQAHFVSSSYVSADMQTLDEQAKALNLTFINEIGLDPGLDHLLAHDLIELFKQTVITDTPNQQHYFRSFCGGFPKIPNAFRYKFSWSPVGVLKALKSSSKWIEDGRVKTAEAPWQALSDYQLPDVSISADHFESFPNRDSTPFVKQYCFPDHWQVQELVRGTLRLAGWSEAWADIFTTVEGLQSEDAERVLGDLSKDLWQQHQYSNGELDRVVLCVEHEVKDGEQTVWHKSYTVDAMGNDRGSAMGRLVSLTVSLAVQTILAGELPSGVLAASNDRIIALSWINQLRTLGETIILTDYVADQGDVVQSDLRKAPVKRA